MKKIDIDIQFERLHEQPKRVEMKLRDDIRTEIFYADKEKTCGYMHSFDRHGYPLGTCWFASNFHFDDKAE